MEAHVVHTDVVAGKDCHVLVFGLACRDVLRCLAVVHNCKKSEKKNLILR